MNLDALLTYWLGLPFEAQLGVVGAALLSLGSLLRLIWAKDSPSQWFTPDRDLAEEARCLRRVAEREFENEEAHPWHR